MKPTAESAVEEKLGEGHAELRIVKASDNAYETVLERIQSHIQSDLVRFLVDARGVMLPTSTRDLRDTGEAIGAIVAKNAARVVFLVDREDVASKILAASVEQAGALSRMDTDEADARAWVIA